MKGFHSTERLMEGREMTAVIRKKREEDRGSRERARWEAISAIGKEGERVSSLRQKRLNA